MTQSLLTSRGTPRVLELHGMSRTPEYMAWRNIIARCCDPKSKDFPRYGGRGITMHGDWQNSFSAFFEHVGPRPDPRHSVDRIENRRGYEPGNVRWATRREQQQNMRSNVLLTHGGETLCVSQWSRQTGISTGTILSRIRRGMTSENVLAPPTKRPTELRGVSFNKRNGNWQAYGKGRRPKQLGSFPTMEEAQAAVRRYEAGE